MRKIDGLLNQSVGKYVIVAARFNNFIVDSLVSAAVDTLRRHGVTAEQITLIHAPGAVELPLVCKCVAEKGDVDAIIALGAVIRGSTPHFDYVCSQASKGLSTVSLDYSLPVIFGVLTTDTIEQAVERAGTKAGNKGADAAVSALEMVDLLKKI